LGVFRKNRLKIAFYWAWNTSKCCNSSKHQ